VQTPKFYQTCVISLCDLQALIEAEKSKRQTENEYLHKNPAFMNKHPNNGLLKLSY
jgi:hypothetical protein